MANAIKWEGPWVDRGDVLTTGLNGLTNTSRSAAGTEVDNSANLDKFGMLEFYTGGFQANPAAGGYVKVLMISAPDGTNYEDGSDSVAPPSHTLVAVFPVRAVTTAQRVMSEPFQIPPAKVKFLLENQAGTNATLAASGNVVALYTNNDEVQ